MNIYLSLCTRFQSQFPPFPSKGSHYSEIGDCLSWPCFHIFSSCICPLAIFYIDSCFKIYIYIHIMYVSLSIMFLDFLFRIHLDFVFLDFPPSPSFLAFYWIVNISSSLFLLISFFVLFGLKVVFLFLYC